ncbi:MAG: L-lactate permease, partial [Atopobiaceae bacterium]|nr:L-lactate permease [Atopobiaceae bacterium]
MGQLFLMFVLALSPIIWLIIALIGLKQQAWIASFESFAVAAVFTYNLTGCTHAMDKSKGMMTSVSSDRRVLTLLIVWCFGNFMEGMAGFGTAVAIPASRMMALGIDPLV